MRRTSIVCGAFAGSRGGNKDILYEGLPGGDVFVAISGLWGREQWRQRRCSMGNVLLLIIFVCCIYAILPSMEIAVVTSNTVLSGK